MIHEFGLLRLRSTELTSQRVEGKKHLVHTYKFEHTKKLLLFPVDKAAS